MSYSVDLDEGMGRAAALFDRILKGAKPADLPLEQPTRFKFAFNLNTAKALRSDRAAPATCPCRRRDRVIGV
jgi:putative ABC transport system substrate-binding protein